MEIRIQEINVTLFIVGIVGDVLRLVAVENFKCADVAGRGRVDAPQFGVLLPQVCFNNLGCSEESQNISVTFR